MINKIAFNIKNGKDIDPSLLSVYDRGTDDSSVASKQYNGPNPYQQSPHLGSSTSLPKSAYRNRLESKQTS